MPVGGAVGRRVAAGAGTHPGRRGERGARHRAARRGVGHRRRPDPQPPRARAGRRGDGAVPGSGVPHRTGAGPSHRVGAHHAARRTPSPTNRTSWSTKPPSARRPRDVPFGFRLAGRSTQRREVDVGEPPRGRQGRDRVRPAADHAHADPWRAHHARVAARAARHAGHPQAAHPAGGAHQRPRPLDARGGRRGVPLDRGDIGHRPRRPVRRRPRAAGRDAEGARGEQDRPRLRRRGG